jgi:hypothetical protein
MKSSVFWDIMQRSSLEVNPFFWRTNHLHLQGRAITHVAGNNSSSPLAWISSLSRKVGTRYQQCNSPVLSHSLARRTEWANRSQDKDDQSFPWKGPLMKTRKHGVTKDDRRMGEKTCVGCVHAEGSWDRRECIGDLGVRRGQIWCLEQGIVYGHTFPRGQPVSRLVWQTFLAIFQEHVRGFHDSLRQKPSSLFTLLWWSSLSISSLMMRSMCLDWWRRCWCFVAAPVLLDLRMSP